MIYENLNVNEKGNLTVGGVDTTYLAEKYGTPLYVFDEDKIRDNCRGFVNSFAKYYGNNAHVHYASKAFSCVSMCKVMAEENMGIDVVSGGELITALKAGFPANRIHFHGNNKTEEEMRLALKSDIESIVIDNFSEFDRLDKLAGEFNKIQDVLLRITPGIEAHTHEFIQTGKVDSKFGFTLPNGDALKAVKKALECKNLHLKGLHCHIASQVCEVEPFVFAAETMLNFVSQIKTECNYEIDELNLGGGFGIKYLQNDEFIPFDSYIGKVHDRVVALSEELNIKAPLISVEPGRAIAATAGLTLYTVGNVKEIEGVRTYASVDGGMGDNPRFILYGSPYTFMIANKAGETADKTVTISGRYCESGDLLGKDIKLANPESGDILAVLGTGAYNYAMASNYNRVPRPAVVFVSNGEDRLVVRRETFEDMILCDII